MYHFVLDHDEENQVYVCDKQLTKKNVKLIESVKTLYRKRDAIETDEYDIDKIQKLYKFMLDNLIKKLGIISSGKSKKRDETRDKTIYKINEDVKEKHNRLIEKMTTQYNYNYDMEEE